MVSRDVRWFDELRLCPFKRESELQDNIAASLIARSWNGITEHRVSLGHIDILAERNGQSLIIEAKMYPLHIPLALGQLLFYAHAFPSASLWIATPRRPSDYVLEVLAARGVSWYDFEEDVEATLLSTRRA